ncbi:murein transglycosylase [Amycolatopsis minnesotensis]|uniref:Murein transglycosylase n=1 Tax=Amycolatopsis minnesotensis TaxID=337894 RepID=A0ABN2R3I7_9PSEU
MAEPAPVDTDPAPSALPPGHLPPRPPYVGRLALAGGLVVTALILIFTVGIDRGEEAADDGPPPPPPALPVPELKPPKGAVAPRAALVAPVDRPKASDEAALDEWSKKVAKTTQISHRTLAAYGRAEMWMRTEAPGCKISWGTVAGIGRVESAHGNFAGAEVGPDGRVTKPIIGPPLNGAPGVKAIKDTEHGVLDGDTEWDRAVGPLQFLPVTWGKWSVRASSDGKPADPQNVDDAALTAARYLCSAGGDLATPDGWWRAVLTYNQSVSYAQDVYSGAEAYAQASLRP